MISTGTQAPKFSLKCKNADGLNEVSLDDLTNGKNAVLLFFPLAFTSVCTKELCSVSGGLACYEDLNANVVGISVDSPFTLEVFAQQNNIALPLLSDFNKSASRAYGVLDEDFLPGKLGFAGVAKRSAFVVNSDGVVTYAWCSDDPGVLPPFDDIQAALKS